MNQLAEDNPQSIDSGDKLRTPGKARLPLKNCPAIADFSYQKKTSELRGGPGGIRQTILSPAQQHIAGRRPLHGSHEPPRLGKPGHSHPQPGAVFQQILTTGDMPEAGDGLQRMQRNFPQRFTFKRKRDTFAFPGKPRMLRCDEQRVQMFFHPSFSHRSWM